MTTPADEGIYAARREASGRIHGQIGPLTSSEGYAVDRASQHATASGTPCGVWQRDGWYAVSETAPDCDDTREADGWTLWAVLDPDEGD